MGGGGLEVWPRDNVPQCSASLRIPHCPGFVLSPVHQGRALGEEIRALCRKGAVEPAPPSPGFYNHMFVVTKASGGWRPIIDLSTLNLSVVKTWFQMETAQSVLCSSRRNNWMVSIDLKDAYLQVPGRLLESLQPSGVVGRTERSSCVSGPSVRESSRCFLGQPHSGVLPLALWGTFSPVLNEVSQQILCWAELKEISIHPQFVPGRDSGVADALSRPNQVIGAEWTLHQEVFDWLRKRWPVNRSFCVLSQSLLWCLFCAGVGSHGCRYGCHAPAMGFSSGVCLSSVRHDSSGSGEAEVVTSHGSHSDSTLFAAKAMVSRSSRSSCGAGEIFCGSLTCGGSTKTSPCFGFMPGDYQALCQSLRFLCKGGWKAWPLRCPSSVANYQSKWVVYRRWCADTDHSVSNPAVSKVAEYFLWL